MSTVCPACANAVNPNDRYCEACGVDLANPEPSSPAAAPSAVPSAAGAAVRSLTSALAPAACAACGGTEFGPEGYCEGCGQRRASTEDHSELDLGVIAAVTDRGVRHHRNEDAVGLAEMADRLIGVVCDGVSTSTRPDVASTRAVAAATPVLVDAIGRGESAPEAVGAAVRAAQAAATLAAGANPGPNPPASTFVCAVVARDAVTVGWVGDSRAYWLPDDGVGDPCCLTFDDAVAGGALSRWLGADAGDTEPHVRVFTPPGSGRVLVCSDGLFKYRPDAGELAAITPRGTALATARELVRFAIQAGGADNISAAVLPYPAPTTRSSRV